MPKRPIHIEELIIKFARGKRLTKEELAELQEWQSRSEEHQALPEKFQDLDWLRENLQRMENVPSDRMWDFIRDKIAVSVQNEPTRTPGHLRRVKQWAPYVAATVVFLVVGWFGRNHLFPSNGQDSIPVPEIAHADTRNGSNHQVLLTLADGRVLPLDHIPNGKVTEIGDLILTKTDSNRLEYTLRPGGKETAINSRVTTGQAAPFQLVFPDGTTALLNYSSSLSSAFHEGQREVELIGEALFETARNRNLPFTVHIKGGGTVDVLGTRFNVMGYADEAAGAITLLSGAVKVTNQGQSKLLRPSQQALVGGDRLVVHTVQDTAGILSWTSKDPGFSFDNTDLNTVVRRIARWHQVKVYNPDNVTGVSITGIFRQKESLEATLGMIDRAESGKAYLKRRGDTIEISRHQ